MKPFHEIEMFLQIIINQSRTNSTNFAYKKLQQNEFKRTGLPD